MARRILAVASGGGHWVQLRRLLPAFEGLDVAFVSVQADYAADVAGRRFHVVRDANRWDRLALLVLAFQIAHVLWRERPDIIVTTGAAPGLLALAIGKVLFGARTLWLDSIANCERISGSGKLARRFADVWLTQWPHLRQESRPDHWGAVL
jgi:UDP-N-acetylglucosamine:LPS N-acetylglucosamine transferase